MAPLGSRRFALTRGVRTQDGLREMVARLDHDADGHVTEEGASAACPRQPSALGQRAVLLAEFLLWWALDDSKEIQGVSMKMVKRAWAAPAEIVYYMFEDPLWFLDMGLKGAPLLLAGTCIVWFVNVMIIVSTFAFCIESVNTFSADPKINPDGKESAEFWDMAWWLIEVSCVFVFTVDFLVRMVCCYVIGTQDKFWKDKMNWIDVLAVLPFYLSVLPDAISDNIVDMRFMRVIRLTRILKSMGPKFAATGGLVADIVVRAAPALVLPLYLMSLFCVFLAGLCYYAEITQYPVCNLDEPIVIDHGSWNETVDVISPWIPQMGLPGTEGCDESTVAVSVDSQNGYILEVNNNGPEPQTVGETMGPDQYIVRNGLRDVPCTADGCGPRLGWGCPCPGTLGYITRDGEQSSEIFPQLTTATWWCVVTFTTVGYGDINPLTMWGQIFAFFVMAVGLFFLAMPLAVVGGAFQVSYNNVERKLKEAKELKGKTDEEIAGEAAEKKRIAAKGDCINTRIDQFGPVVAHATVKAHLMRVRGLSKTLYDVTPDGHDEIKEKMRSVQAKLRAAEFNASKMEIQHDELEDAQLAGTEAFGTE